MEKVKNFALSLKDYGFALMANFFEKFFSAWLLSAAVFMAVNPDSLKPGGITLLLFTASVLFVFFAFHILNHRFKGSIYPILTVSVLAFSVVLVCCSNNFYTYIATAIIFVLSAKHYIDKKDGLKFEMKKKYAITFFAVTFIFFFGILTATSVLRYLTYSTPNYDFGIFCNMFYNMKESLRPVTSSERDQILSHFAVHFSPAMYVFLPIYFVFPSPVTIAVCQTVAIFSGVIPFILIMKHKGLKPFNICLFAVVYMANAAYTAGCLYDFHENCLLPVFIMWMFWFYEKRKMPLIFLFALLTLMVKEDAFIYVAVFAVYIIFAKKDFKTGIALAALALAYFGGATYILKNYGTGIMSNRFESMIDGDEGLFGIIKTVFTNPGYTVKQIFNTQEPSPKKLIYFLQLLTPLALIPFITKKPLKLILVLPILLNLLTDYPYQYEISFQYGFGLMSLLLYLCVLNLEEMNEKKRDFACVTAAGLATIMFFTLIIPKFATQASMYNDNSQMYEEMNEVLDTIPEDAKVAASTFLIPYLSERTEIYETYYTTQTDFDYVVFDMRDAYKEESLKKAKEYEKKGYKLYDNSSQYVHIYKK